MERLLLDADGMHFSLPSRLFRTDSAPGSRAVFATDRRASSQASGILVQLPAHPTTLVTTAIWRIDTPDAPPREVRHVIQWLLPAYRTSLMSDDTWLWPDSPDIPRLSPGDWPILEPTLAPYPRSTGRGLTVIDSRNREGKIIRRYQTFPLVALLPDAASDRIPDEITLLT